MQANVTQRTMSLWLLAGLYSLLFLGVISLSLSDAQENRRAPNMEGPHVSDPVAPVEMENDMSMEPIEVPLQEDPVEVPLREEPLQDGSLSVSPEGPPASQTFVPQVATVAGREIPPEFSMPNPNFDGINQGDAGANFIPPDTNGDVGPNHYVQTVNSSIMIFDKQGTTLAGPMRINILFSPLGGPCATGSVIDPIVNYDPLADRWVVMGFPFNSPICIAVSQTNDPVAGGWFLYAFDVTAFGFPDYPKLGVWPDAYYLTTQRGFPGGGLDVYALDREQMLLGNPAVLVHFFVAPPSLFLLPADLDGPPPSTGTPAPFVRHVDGNLWGGEDRLEVFEFSINFQNPASSTFNFVVELPTDPFRAVLCGSRFFGNCAEQPNGRRLETLPAWLMWRLQYRNFGTHETLVANHTIDVDGQDHAGVRWYELRRSDSRQWTIFQQGTFAPQDPAADSFLHRWMGSIAMDKEGNIALGFSASSRTLVPSVRYVGRRVMDPLGSLPQGDSPDGDFVMVNGKGSQFASRWGDYSSMNMDPVDGCTFWYTQQYVDVNNRWSTRIGAFRFPSCDREMQRVQCAAYLEGPAIDPDGNEMPMGAIIPVGDGLFRQGVGERPRADFEVVNVAFPCGTRLDVCLQNNEEAGRDILLQQIFLCDIDNLAVGRAEINERSGNPVLNPQPDFETRRLSEVVGNEDNICDAVVGRILRVTRSESRSSPCNEEAVLEGLVEDVERSFFP